MMKTPRLSTLKSQIEIDREHFVAGYYNALDGCLRLGRGLVGYAVLLLIFSILIRNFL